MENQQEILYGINDKPGMGLRILLGFQHIFAAFGGIIVVPIIIASSLGLDAAGSAALISGTILAAGITTIVQSKGVGPVGARVAAIMGTDFTFVAPALAVGATLGLPGIVGATVFGAAFAVLLSFFIRPLMRFFPLIISGIVVTLIGVTLIPVAMDWMAGGVGAPDYGSMQNIGIALVVMVFTLLLNYFGKGLLSSASILIGMVFGFFLCMVLGMVDFSSVREASWFQFPQLLRYGIEFNFQALATFVPAYIVSIIGTVGCIKAIQGVSGIPESDRAVSGGVLADSLGSMLAGFVGGMPNTTFTQNIGVLSLTKVVSRYVTIMAGIILVVLGFLPKFAALINIMPSPVLGGVGVVMFGMVASSGIQLLQNIPMNSRNMLIVATSIGLGLGVTYRPEMMEGMPTAVNMIFSSGISTGTIVAIILNIVFREK